MQRIFGDVDGLRIRAGERLDVANELFENGKLDIIVDMTECDFVSSAGLRVIVAMQKRVVNNGSLVFRGVQSDVMDVFEMTGFSKILTFE